MEKVFVHKPYIISSLGLGLDENTEKLFSGQSGSKLINTPKYYPSAFFGSEIIQERFQDFFQKEFPQLVEKHPFFEQLLIYSIQQSIKNIDLDITTKDTLLIISSTKGNIDLLSKSQQNKWESDRVYLWKSAQIIQKFFGLKNKVMVLSNACISGIEAIAVGSRMIRSGNYKQVIVAGADILSEFVVSGFQSFQSLSPTLCAPYDKDRVGLNLGEAAGSLLLTSSEYESDIEVLGSGISNDANHISGPSRTGEGLFLAIKSALAESKLNAEDISFISGHGTATSYNDEMESKAFELANLDQTPINSLKGYWGHTLGAAGLIEAIASFASLRQNKLIKTLGYQNHGVSVEIPVIRETTEQINNTFLKTASGFGGANAAIIFKKTKTMSSISNHIYFEKNCFYSDFEPHYNFEKSLTFDKVFKAIYKDLQVDYPKYFKMDYLSKLGFLATEVLLQNKVLTEQYSSDKIGIILGNSASTYLMDEKHQLSLEDKNAYYPSPANFVYTLPNIMTGEICIKHKFKGENAVFIMEHFDADFIAAYTNKLFIDNKIDACVIGYVNIDKENYEAFLILVEKKDSKQIFNAKALEEIYKNIKLKLMDKLIEELKVEIIEALNLEDMEPDEIDANEPLFGDGLGLDSIDALELIVLLEKNYGIKIENPKDGKEIFKSVQTMAEYIQAHKK